MPWSLSMLPLVIAGWLPKAQTGHRDAEAVAILDGVEQVQASCERVKAIGNTAGQTPGRSLP
ncbi:hypothetical protein FQZ97_868970 [compost metagenome]